MKKVMQDNYHCCRTTYKGRKIFFIFVFMFVFTCFVCVQNVQAAKDDSQQLSSGELNEVKKLSLRLKGYTLKAQAETKQYILEVKELNKKLEKAKEDLQQQQKESGQREEKLKKQLADAAWQMELLRATNEQIAAAFKESETQDEKLRAQLEQKEKQSDKGAAAELEMLKKENERLITHNDTLINEKRGLLLKMVNYQKQSGFEEGTQMNKGSLDVASEEINYLKTEFDNLNALLNKAYEELSRVKERNNEMSKENVQLLTQAAQIKKQLEEKEKKAALTEDLIREKEREYAAKLENNKNEFNEQLKGFQGMANELEKKNALTNKDKELYISQLEDYKNRFTALQNEYEEVNNNSQILKKRLRQMYEKEKAWRETQESDRTLLVKYSTAIDDLNGQLIKAQAEIQQFNLLLKTMPDNLSRLERELNDTRMENSNLHYNLGVFYTQKLEYTQAIDEFKKALQSNENDANVHYNLGIIYSRYIIDEAKAISHFKHYLSIAPNDKDAQRAKEYLLIWGTKDNKR
ncbi:MAG: tetratricopeptide repeat protein [Candidatus Omnitrophica bacterium]|nr:tetratricopeptide repeat protein [Candidatus Omnitrophota bacterium]